MFTYRRQGEMVGVDPPHTRKWLKFSDAVTVDLWIYSMRQTADSGDYWRETPRWAVCE